MQPPMTTVDKLLGIILGLTLLAVAFIAFTYLLEKRNDQKILIAHQIQAIKDLHDSVERLDKSIVQATLSFQQLHEQRNELLKPPVIRPKTVLVKTIPADKTSTSNKSTGVHVKASLSLSSVYCDLLSYKCLDTVALETP